MGSLVLSFLFPVSGISSPSIDPDCHNVLSHHRPRINKARQNPNEAALLQAVVLVTETESLTNILNASPFLSLPVAVLR